MKALAKEKLCEIELTALRNEMREWQGRRFILTTIAVAFVGVAVGQAKERTSDPMLSKLQLHQVFLTLYLVLGMGHAVFAYPSVSCHPCIARPGYLWPTLAGGVVMFVSWGSLLDVTFGSDLPRTSIAACILEPRTGRNTTAPLASCSARPGLRGSEPRKTCCGLRPGSCSPASSPLPSACMRSVWGIHVVPVGEFERFSASAQPRHSAGRPGPASRADPSPRNLPQRWCTAQRSSHRPQLAGATAHRRWCTAGTDAVCTDRDSQERSAHWLGVSSTRERAEQTHERSARKRTRAVPASGRTG